MPDRAKRVTMNLDTDLMPWIDYAAGVAGQSMTEYINAAVRRERDGATGAMAAGFEAFERARAEQAPSAG